MKHLLVLFLLLSAPVWGAEIPNQKTTVISLSARAQAELPNDEAVVYYRIEATGPKAGVLREKVNRISRAVHARLKKETGLKQTTLSRRMEILWRYDKRSSKRMRDGWKLVQREQVISRNPDTVADWVDDIEKAGVYLDRLGFRMAEATLSSAKERLRLQAVQKFRARASSMAKALDASSYKVMLLKTDFQQPAYPIRGNNREMVAMKASADTIPAVNIGESRVSVSVSGKIEVEKKSFPVN